MTDLLKEASKPFGDTAVTTTIVSVVGLAILLILIGLALSGCTFRYNSETGWRINPDEPKRTHQQIRKDHEALPELYELEKIQPMEGM